MNYCENCGRELGQQERAYILNNCGICADCYIRCTRENAPPLPPPEMQVARAHVKEAEWVDHLANPRYVVLALIAASVFIVQNNGLTVLLVAIWAVLGIASLIMKANWKAARQR